MTFQDAEVEIQAAMGGAALALVNPETGGAVVVNLDGDTEDQVASVFGEEVYDL